MSQFDVYRDPENSEYPLLLDIQDDTFSRLASRVVVPMMSLKRFGGKPITRLNPTVTIRGVEYVLLFQLLAAVSSRGFGTPVTSLRDRRSEWVAALDLLFTGG